MNKICMYCEHWAKDKSHELDMISFYNMTGWENAKTEGWCSEDKIITVYDDTCENYMEY